MSWQVYHLFQRIEKAFCMFNWTSKTSSRLYNHGIYMYSTLLNESMIVLFVESECKHFVTAERLIQLELLMFAIQKRILELAGTIFMISCDWQSSTSRNINQVILISQPCDIRAGKKDETLVKKPKKSPNPKSKPKSDRRWKRKSENHSENDSKRKPQEWLSFFYWLQKNWKFLIIPNCFL